eukprot:CAMPEP_0174267532 /NCGR_PEP_ID=MMETSP0439-20130205/33976_1 /TAXON_ID=0 /ORGANISM="Stereomyxa ramosa, Strain Chinc5" /LENGTH=266 /DNA_ID=CAMNT_0015355079 /DNA_START=324 /DNA_END=1124 /DNA_ORIENTATION=-
MTWSESYSLIGKINCSVVENSPLTSIYLAKGDQKLLPTSDGFCVLGVSVFVDVEQVGGPGKGGNAVYFTILTQTTTSNFKLGNLDDIVEYSQIPGEIAGVDLYGLFAVFPNSASWKPMADWYGPFKLLADTVITTTKQYTSISIENPLNGESIVSVKLGSTWNIPVSHLASNDDRPIQYIGIADHAGIKWAFMYMTVPTYAGTFSEPDDKITPGGTTGLSPGVAQLVGIWYSLDVTFLHKTCAGSGMIIYPFLRIGDNTDPSVPSY